MNPLTWTLGPGDGELVIRTDVAGPAAKMGHRLTIVMRGWQASVEWRDDEPVAAALTVDVDTLDVIRGEGGLTPLSPPERAVARANALRSFDAKRFPRIGFNAEQITRTAGGYRLAGPLEIHGQSRPQTVDVNVVESNGEWTLSARTSVRQSAFGVKPFSLMMGALKVADDVIVAFSATRRL